MSPTAEIATISIPEMCRRLSIGTTTGWQLVWSGAIPSITIGRKSRRVRVVDLNAYLDRLAAEQQAA